MFIFQEISKLGGSLLVLDSSLYKILSEVYPQENWDESKFVRQQQPQIFQVEKEAEKEPSSKSAFQKKSQSLLQKMLKQILPYEGTKNHIFVDFR